MSVLTIGMIKHSSQDHGATCAATCRSAKSTIEPGAFPSQLIEVGRLNCVVAIATGVRTLVIGYEQDDIPLGVGPNLFVICGAV